MLVVKTSVTDGSGAVGAVSMTIASRKNEAEGLGASESTVRTHFGA